VPQSLPRDFGEEKVFESAKNGTTKGEVNLTFMDPCIIIQIL